MAKQTSDTRTLFSDDFKRPLSDSRWDYNHWQPKDNPSFYGRTQQKQWLPDVENGVLRLKLETYNPGGAHDSFFGSEAITKQKFGIDGNKGLAFEIKAKFENVPKGIVGGFFTYAGNAQKHDEIDFEALSNRPTEIQTNVYADEPLGAGHTQFKPVTGTLNDYHTYRIEWTKNEVRWLIDGVEVRSETAHVPKNAQALHLNIWAPSADWAAAYDGNLQPSKTKGGNQSFYFDVDYAKVTEIAVQYGGSGNNALRGTAKADRMEGGRGDDTLRGHKGADTLIGDEGNDVLKGGAGKDDLNGGAGNDVLKGGKGKDTFVFDSALGPDNVDTIRDFQPGTDTIELSSATFAAISPGWLRAEALHHGSTAADEDDRILYDAGTGELFYDADGSGSIAPVLFAKLAPGLDLSAGDFLVA